MIFSEKFHGDNQKSIEKSISKSWPYKVSIDNTKLKSVELKPIIDLPKNPQNYVLVTVNDKVRNF